MKIPRKYFSDLAKKSHRMSPRKRSHFVKMQKLSVAKRRLSTHAKKQVLRAVR